MSKYGAHFKTTWGCLTVIEENGCLLFLSFDEEPPFCYEEKETPLLRQAFKEVLEYQQGTRTVFDLPYQLNGTCFQQKVWKTLISIPYGETRSYKDVAKQVGSPKAYRAVGGAAHKNLLLLLIPCHRLIGTNGSLTGFRGGLLQKEKWLLFEKEHLIKRQKEKKGLK